MVPFLDIPELATPQIQRLSTHLDGLMVQLKNFPPVSPSPRISVAFQYLQDLVNEHDAFSLCSILKLHELIGEDGKLRGDIKSFFDENNIAIRGYHPAQARDLEEIIDCYILKYHPARSSHNPLLKIAGAYLTFALIHPFRDGNGRVGRLITAWLMFAHGYNKIAPFIEKWMGNENREHGKLFESHIRNYLAWCNPQFSPALSSFVEQFFIGFLQELVRECQKVIDRSSTHPKACFNEELS